MTDETPKTTVDPEVEAPPAAPPADETPPAPEAPAATAAAEPRSPYIKPTSRYTARFVVLYIALGAVLAGAVVGLVMLLAGHTSLGGSSSKGWSSWKPPSGTTAQVADSIASHVAHEYHLNKAGAQLLAVVAGPPQLTNGTHKVQISHVAVRKKANSDTGIQIATTGSTWTYQFCGLGTGCSIASGKASETRGRLVRREALEVALYTFKFVPAVKSVVAFMPPPPGQTTTTLLYLQKDALTQQLKTPLDKTLQLAKPPLPTVPDAKESATIDKLTLPFIYSYSVQELQDNSALLILDPLAQ